MVAVAVVMMVAVVCPVRVTDLANVISGSKSASGTVSGELRLVSGEGDWDRHLLDVAGAECTKSGTHLWICLVTYSVERFKESSL